MSTYALPGVFSGIDTDTLVAAAMVSIRRPLARLQQQRSSWQAKTGAVEEIERRMEHLLELVDGLRDADELRTVSATSSDANRLTVTAVSGAAEGVHDVVIAQLASAERKVHAGVTPTETWTHSREVADPDDEYLSAEEISDSGGEDYRFVFQFGSESQVTVDLSAYDATGITLAQLVSEINAAAGYTAASAALVDGQYQLRIQAGSAGGDRSLTITDDSSVGVLDGTDDFAQTVDGDVGSDTIMGAGQFVYTYNGVTRTVTTTADTTLGQLRDRINNDAENPGVTASILDYQGAAGGQYHLVLSGQNTGADYAIAVEASTSLAGFGPGEDNWTETQAARNAKIRVDGYPSGGWIEKSSNTIADVLEGVTLNLHGVSASVSTKAAESSDTAVLTAQASDAAADGAHQIEVNQLAKAERLVHTSGMISMDSLVGAGQFVYQYSGVTRTITTDATTTLADLRDAINDDSGNPGVIASILEYDGMYHLVLDGEDTGSDYDIVITGATTLGQFESADFTEVQDAQDAWIKIDGYPAGPGNWIERSSNTLTDVIPGVTVTLKDTGTAGVTVRPAEQQEVDSVAVNLTRYTQALKTDLQNLAEVYNGIVDTVEEYAGYDPATQTAGVLIGDAGLNTLLSRIRSALVTGAPGFQAGDESYTLPAQIGIEIDRDGHLSVDTAVLDEALADDYFGVLALIGAIGTGASSSSNLQYDGATPGTSPGTYEVQVEFDGGGSITAASIRTQGETEWRDASWNGNVITGLAGNPEAGLQMTFVWESGLTSPLTAEVRVQQGFAGSLYDRLDEILDPLDGAIPIKKDRYADAITQLNRRIETEQDRVAEREQRLREKYARLEATLAQLDSLRAAFDSVLTALESLNNSRQSSR